MPATPFDSALYRDLFRDEDVAALFTDSAEIRAMLLVEGALARVQGRLAVIPEVSGAAIQRAAMEAVPDPAVLAAATGANGVPVPALVAAFREEMAAPEHAQYVHWGATSQDIMDTALMLRLARLLEIAEARLGRILSALAGLAEAHRALPCPARTWGQAATPTSFGAVAAGWGAPLLDHRARLAEMRPRVLTVSLSGAAGTLSAMGSDGPEVRAGLAGALGLADPGRDWHADRARLGEIAGWLAGVTASLGKMGEDVTLLAQSGIGEVALGGGGASSTMPQKSNPVRPSLLVALARQAAALEAALRGAGIHREARDGAAWMTEWMAMPALCHAAGRALSLAGEVAGAVAPVPERMAAALEAGQGSIHAEALSFALAARMPRPDAQARVKELCREAAETGTPLLTLAETRWPGVSGDARLTAEGCLGDAPAEADRFARAVRATD